MQWPSSLLDPSEYSDIRRLVEDALAMVESNGDPSARRPGSKYVGLLQIGPAYAQDAGIPESRYVRELLGNASASRDAFRSYMERYVDVHGYSPALMAVLHHAGPGVARKTRRELEDGAPMDKALARATADVSWTDAEKEMVYLARAFGWLSQLLATRGSGTSSPRPVAQSSQSKKDWADFFSSVTGIGLPSRRSSSSSAPKRTAGGVPETTGFG